MWWLTVFVFRTACQPAINDLGRRIVSFDHEARPDSRDRPVRSMKKGKKGAEEKGKKR